jgi:predicted NAD/FAD-dependent oxidoreductase
MRNSSSVPTIAVLGAGLAGVACAASLQRAGWQVTLFDKSRGVGGRMSTRRAQWQDAEGVQQEAEFDHGAAHFGARHPRFRAVLARAQSVGCVQAWSPRIHRHRPAALAPQGFVAVPHMPALCRHLAAGVPQRLGATVQRLQRDGDGWRVMATNGASATPQAHGPFDHVVLAMPPAQAAVLLAGHQDSWADQLASVPMAPCWTFMAVTDDVDWTWDAAEPDRGPLGWVGRNDRKPGRSRTEGRATWVAHATPAWSAAHLEAEPDAVTETLSAALQLLLPGAAAPAWRFRSVHRWRYALPMGAAPQGPDCWWDPALRLGVCGDFLGRGTVESAWRSGDELADTMAAWLESRQEPMDARARVS